MNQLPVRSSKLAKTLAIAQASILMLAIISMSVPSFAIAAVTATDAPTGTTAPTAPTDPTPPCTPATPATPAIPATPDIPANADHGLIPGHPLIPGTPGTPGTCPLTDTPPASCTITSDTTTLANGVPSVATYVHPVWTTIPGATWIWKTLFVDTGLVPDTTTFTKQVSLASAPTSATLTIAADNTYTVLVNGVAPSCDGTQLDNFSGTDTCAVTNLTSGTNNLTFTVTNTAGDADPTANPAGLDYKLDVTGASCGEVPPPVDQCTNIDGIQSIVPDGYTANADHFCSPIVVAPTCNADTELLTNGNFEAPTVTSGDGWDLFPSGTPGLGWMVSWFSPVGGQPATANIELQKSGLFGWLPSLGGLTQWAELDSDWNKNGGGIHQSATDLSQDVPTIVGDTYTFSYDFSPRPGTAQSENKAEALAGGVVIGTSGPTDGSALPNTSWTSQSFSFVATSTTTHIEIRDAGTPNDSIGALVDNASVRCTPTRPVNKIHVVASKVVCTDEKDLPNWGAGGHGPIGATTAADWVAAHDAKHGGTCHLEDGWNFQWGNSSTGDGGNATIGEVAGYTSFGPTVSGVASTDIPMSSAGSEVHLREVLQNGFIPFTYDAASSTPDGNNVSAEFYCADDALHYDNWDFIRNPVAGANYYCVAFNAPKVVTPTKFKVHVFKYLWNGETANQISNSFEGPQFPMIATYSIAGIGTNLNPGDGYALGNGGGAAGSDGGLLYAANTIPLSAGDTYGTHEVTGGNSVVVANSEECTPGKYSLNGYKVGDTLSAAESAAISGTAPNFLSISKDEYVIVVNTACPSGGGGNGGASLHIIKKTIGGDGKFNFNVTNNGFGEDATTHTSATTNDGTGQTNVNVTSGQHDVTENVPEGWHLDSVHCVYDDESIGESIHNGEFITVDKGDSVITCTFTNSKMTETNETIVVKAADLDSTSANPLVVLADGLNKWFFYNDTTDVVDNTLGSFVTGPSTAPLGTGSAEMTDAAANSRPDIATFQFSGTPLANITSLAFSSYSHSGVAGPNESPYLVFNVDFTGSSGAFQKRLVYVPANNMVSVPQDAWVTNDTIQSGAGNWVYSGATWPAPLSGAGATPKTWAQILAAYPNARLLPAGGFMGVRVGEPGPATYTGDVDKFVIGIKTGFNTDTKTFDFEPTAKVTGGGGPAQITSGGSGGGGGGGGSPLTPTVAGASTSTPNSCSPIITEFLKFGWKNNPEQVKLLQQFLNDNLGLHINVTGFFGPMTFSAVKVFQKQQWENVLKPWFGLPGSGIDNQNDPTGFVYQTTKWRINNIVCPGSEAFPDHLN